MSSLPHHSPTQGARAARGLASGSITTPQPRGGPASARAPRRQPAPAAPQPEGASLLPRSRGWVPRARATPQTADHSQHPAPSTQHRRSPGGQHQQTGGLVGSTVAQGAGHSPRGLAAGLGAGLGDRVTHRARDSLVGFVMRLVGCDSTSLHTSNSTPHTTAAITSTGLPHTRISAHPHRQPRGPPRAGGHDPPALLTAPVPRGPAAGGAGSSAASTSTTMSTRGEHHPQPGPAPASTIWGQHSQPEGCTNASRGGARGCVGSRHDPQPEGSSRASSRRTTTR